MADKWFELDASEIDAFQKMMEDYGTDGEIAIDNVLHNEGAEEIKQQIHRILPISGRKWKGKHQAAKNAMPSHFEKDEDILAVTIAARNNYSYLYFPDDGSNTEHHAGNQQFMRRGAENATSKIIELCTGRLVEKFEQGGLK